MKLIVEEEKEQLLTIQIQIDESRSKLKPFKDKPFEKCNNLLKKGLLKYNEI